MNWKALAVFLTALAIGTGLFLNLNQIMTVIQDKIGPLGKLIGPTVQSIQDGIGKIPSEWRTFLLISAPVAAVGYLINWYRTRQMNELAKQSMAKIQELSTLNMNANQLQGVSQAKIQELQGELTQYQQSNMAGTIQSLQSQLADQKVNYESQLQKTLADMEAMERAYQNTIADLKMKTQIVYK